MYCTRCCCEALYIHGASWISYAKWCDLMVNHDADRRLCQYLIEPVCWWHFPFFISLEFCEALYIHLFLSTVMEMPFLLCQLMWPYGQPWCGQKALPISDKTGLLMAFCCYDILSNWLLLQILGFSWNCHYLNVRELWIILPSDMTYWSTMMRTEGFANIWKNWFADGIFLFYYPFKLVSFGFLLVRFVGVAWEKVLC